MQKKNFIFIALVLLIIVLLFVGCYTEPAPPPIEIIREMTDDEILSAAIPILEDRGRVFVDKEEYERLKALDTAVNNTSNTSTTPEPVIIESTPKHEELKYLHPMGFTYDDFINKLILTLQLMNKDNILENYVAFLSNLSPFDILSQDSSGINSLDGSNLYEKNIIFEDIENLTIKLKIVSNNNGNVLSINSIVEAPSTSSIASRVMIVSECALVDILNGDGSYIERFNGNFLVKKNDFETFRIKGTNYAISLIGDEEIRYSCIALDAESYFEQVEK